MRSARSVAHGYYSIRWLMLPSPEALNGPYLTWTVSVCLCYVLGFKRAVSFMQYSEDSIIVAWLHGLGRTMTNSVVRTATGLLQVVTELTYKRIFIT